MTQQGKEWNQGDKAKTPQPGEIAKQEERQKAEQQEVAGRHKNDGQKSHKARR